MNVSLDIPVGEWRDLTPEELKTINSMVSDSEKTANSSHTKRKNPENNLLEKREKHTSSKNSIHRNEKDDSFRKSKS